MSVAAACPRCSTAVGLSRWCGTCGIDLRSDLPPVDILESRMAATQEQRWLAANTGATIAPPAPPPQTAWAPPAGASAAPLAPPYGALIAAPSFAAPPPVPVRFAPVRARSLLATRWLSFMFLFSLAALVLDGLWLQEQSRPDWTVDDMVALGKLVDATAVAQIVVYLIGALLFIVWFHRAYANLPALGISHPRRGKGWAIGSWFIPIANLFIPKQLANDVWRSGDPELRPGHPQWLSAPVAAAVHWWWALWLASNFASAIASNVMTDAQSLDAFNDAMVMDAVAQVLGMASAVAAIAVVKRATRRQEARARVLEPPGAAPA